MADKFLSFMGKAASLIADKFKISRVYNYWWGHRGKDRKKHRGKRGHNKGRVFAGYPHGLLFKGKLGGIPVITKAGGFGQENTIIKSIEKLREDP